MRASLAAICAFVLFSAVASAADGTFTGYARSLDTGELLYVESHAVHAAATAGETRVVLYRCAAGAAPFARKELEYGTDRLAPAFNFEDARSGFFESLERDGRRLTVSARAGAHAAPRFATLIAAGALVADAGFDDFVRARWEALERGASVQVPFLVPSRLDSVQFRVRKVAQKLIAGEAASVIRLSLAGPLGWFLPDIDVSYRQRDRRLMRYRGLTNIRDAGGSLLEAQIDFPDADRSAAAPDLAAWRALPLVSRCE
jgi:hypothetical protein